MYTYISGQDKNDYSILNVAPSTNNANYLRHIIFTRLMQQLIVRIPNYNYKFTQRHWYSCRMQIQRYLWFYMYAGV